MAPLVNVNFKLDENVKKNLEQVCDELGLSMSAAFTVFARKVVRENRIPFEVSVDPAYEATAARTPQGTLSSKSVITREYLEQRGVYKRLLEFFDANFPSGKAEYQELLSTLVADSDGSGWGITASEYLFRDIGATEETLRLTGQQLNGSLFFPGHIKIESDEITIHGTLCAGGNIDAHGCRIKTSDHLMAAGNIEAEHIDVGRNIWAKNVTAMTGIGVDGFIEVQGGITAISGSVESGNSIEVHDDIVAGKDITALYSITGWNIAANGNVSATTEINARNSIAVGGKINAEKVIIKDAVKYAGDFVAVSG